VKLLNIFLCNLSGKNRIIFDYDKRSG
jgi:hypothetical protein